jgi:branched-chain amino acid transport system ATP-binding protein
MAAPEPLSLAVRGLVAGHAETRVLEGVDFAVPAGGRLAVLGRNGAGKTTLLATLMGLTTRHAGEISLGEQRIEHLSTIARARLGLGLVPQTRDIFPSLTVEENLITGLKGHPPAELARAYALFPRLAERRRNGGGQLSGGEQQMLSIARALMGRPGVLLLDEPLEGLAPVICEELMRVFRRLGEEQRITTVLVEQHVDDALDFADNALVLDRGRIVFSGTSAALRAQPQIIARSIGVAQAETI